MSMQQIGFDNDKYLKMQSEHIQHRIAQFDNKLYLELGGKLFDDYHASRVLPGFKPDSKINMLLKLKEQAEIVIVINAADIEKSKVRGDLGITYDAECSASLTLSAAWGSLWAALSSPNMPRSRWRINFAICWTSSACRSTCIIRSRVIQTISPSSSAKRGLARMSMLKPAARW